MLPSIRFRPCMVGPDEVWNFYYYTENPKGVLIDGYYNTASGEFYNGASGVLAPSVVVDGALFCLVAV